MISACTPWASDAAAYALGALDEREAADFAEHLETCRECREELSELSVVTAQLALAAPQYTAPRRLRRAVLAQARTPSRRRPRTRTGLLAFAAAVIAVVAVLAARGGPPATPRATLAIAAHMVGSRGQGELRVAGGHAELVVTGVPAPPRGKVYEVWLLGTGERTPRPAGALFGVGARGTATVAIPGRLRAVDELLVTREPAGGSQTPTSSPVMTFRLT